jgi:hypothetical protein
VASFAEAALSSTLMFEGKHVEGAKICLFKREAAAPTACGIANVFGEYVLLVPPGSYRIEIRTAHGEMYRSSVELPHSGQYRNRIGIDPKNEPSHR